MHHICGKTVGKQPCDRQANAIHRDAVTDFRMLQNRLRTDGQHGGALSPHDLLHSSNFFDDAGEHG